MQIYRIDRGIKVPPVSRAVTVATTSRAAATLQQLKRGESFRVRDAVEAMRANKVMRDFARRERARSSTRTFVSRKTGAGVRIWRTQ